MFSNPASGSHQKAARIGAAAEAEYSEALEFVLGDLPPDVCTVTRDQLLSAASGDVNFLDGLIVARQAGKLRGAVWARSGDGRLASVWPPRVRPGESEGTIAGLLEALDAYLERRRVKLAQSLLDPADEEGLTRLIGDGYRVSTDLLYLVCAAGRFPDRRPESPLDFEPYARDQHQRMVELVNRTYAETRDFPELNDVCDAIDALAGYRETGAMLPENWLFVRHSDADIGCLLLADHPQNDQYELLYMGLVPQARGKSFGAHVGRYAQWLTGAAGRSQLVLGVDASNAPALRMYADLGFLEWDRRRVLLKEFGD